MKMNIKNIDIDLRQEFDEMIKEWSYPVILLNVGPVPCPCAATELQQASPLCHKCLGIGTNVHPEKILAIGREASQYLSLPNNVVGSPIGELYSNAKIFYIKYDKRPAIGSFIYEVSWDKKGRPISLIGYYKIAYAEPSRMNNGRTEYMTLATHRELSNMALREKYMKNLIIQLRW